MGFHDTATTGDIHIPYQWSYADATARAAATGFVSTDVGKLAYQEDNTTLWLLSATTPTWAAVSVGGSSFLQLLDTPSSYSGDGGKVVVVKATEDGIEFSATGSVDEAKRLYVQALKSTAGTIAKGEAVYVVGFNVGSGYVTIEKAKADSSTTMPSIGVANEEITEAVTGKVIIGGYVEGLVTSGYLAQDSMYVSAATAGALQNTWPTGAGSLIQKVAQVTYSHASAGRIEVFGAGRSNALPNIAKNKYWVGDSDGIAQPNWIIDSYYAESNGEDSTTGTTYVQKVRLTFTPIAAGNYEVNFSLLIGTNNTGVEMNTRVFIDETTVKKKVSINIVSAYPDMGCRAGNFVLVGLTAAEHTIDIEYASGSSGKTLYIAEATVTARRIGQG